jgi:hypothetical protein
MYCPMYEECLDHDMEEDYHSQFTTECYIMTQIQWPLACKGLDCLWIWNGPILAPSRPPFKLLAVEKAHRFYHVLLPGLQRIECALRAPQPTQSSTPNPFCISNPDRSNPISNALSLGGGPPVSLILDLGNNFQAITDYYRPWIPNASRFLAILNS